MAVSICNAKAFSRRVDIKMGINVVLQCAIRKSLAK